MRHPQMDHRHGPRHGPAGLSRPVAWPLNGFVWYFGGGGADGKCPKMSRREAVLGHWFAAVTAAMGRREGRLCVGARNKTHHFASWLGFLEAGTWIARTRDPARLEPCGTGHGGVSFCCEPAGPPRSNGGGHGGPRSFDRSPTVAAPPRSALTARQTVMAPPWSCDRSNNSHSSNLVQKLRRLSLAALVSASGALGST